MPNSTTEAHQSYITKARELNEQRDKLLVEYERIVSDLQAVKAKIKSNYDTYLAACQKSRAAAPRRLSLVEQYQTAKANFDAAEALLRPYANAIKVFASGISSSEGEQRTGMTIDEVQDGLKRYTAPWDKANKAFKPLRKRLEAQYGGPAGVEALIQANAEEDPDLEGNEDPYAGME
jgi:chromosome segregation ATPase